jgi:hypothetical protein
MKAFKQQAGTSHCNVKYHMRVRRGRIKTLFADPTKQDCAEIRVKVTVIMLKGYRFSLIRQCL